ncbi:amino acid transporter [Bdellovibrio bacteriovorus]|uniref:Amino acid transporter n=1 Tax=Bdellovibrio bacteriovorus TaxID=959 RepID=A0A162H3M1_BDEBC|nr:APC family permease [Bdellovibrio bacteriovorus]KYG69589.1 amino acid transporter [Bdellovibrio bacteriovorus]
MKKSLSLFHLTFYGTGMILGAGIYSVIGKAGGVAENGLWVSFLLAAFCASLTALSYAELATTFPKTGGEYIYVKNIFPQWPYLAMLCGSMMIFAGISTATTVAIAFSGYIQQFAEVPQFVTAFCLLGVFTLVNIIGIKESSWVNVVFTLIEILGLLIFVWVGTQSPKFGEALSEVRFDGAVISGAALVIFAYFGFENIVNLVEESKTPEKDLPKGIIISLGVSTVLYLLVSLTALALGSPEELGRSNAPLSDLTRDAAAWVPRTLGAIALFSTANTVLISMISTSRIIFSMARERDLPSVFSKLLSKRATPWMGALAVFGLAMALLPAGGIEVVASASSFATMIAFTVINIALIYLRFKEPHRTRPFKVPISIGRWPLIPTLAACVSSGLLFFFSREVYVLGAGVFVFVSVLYIVLKSRKSD